LVATLFVAIGLLMLASPEGGTDDTFFSLPFGIGALAIGLHLLWNHRVVTRFRYGLKCITLGSWTAAIILSALALVIAAMRVSIDSGPFAQQSMVYWGLIAIMTLVFVVRRRLFQSVKASGVPSAWRDHIAEPMALAVCLPQVIDPLGRVLRKRKLRGWQLYVVALVITSTVASSNLVLVWMGLGWWEPDRWGRMILVRSLFIFLTTVFVFPLALWQASQLKSVVGSLRRRAIRAADSSPWPSFAAFRRECLREASRWQGFAYRGFIYLALGVILWTLVAMVSFALDTTPASPASEYLHRSPIRGVPLVLTLGGVALIAVGFLYFVVVTVIRAVLAVRWLYRSQKNFVFDVDPRDPKGCGGFSDIGNYAATMVITPLILSMWTSFVAFRNAEIQEAHVIEQLAEQAPLYAFEVSLLLVGTALPLIVGRSILRHARQDRLNAIDEAMSRAKAESDKEREGRLFFERRAVEAIPGWPIDRRRLVAMASAAALLVATIWDLAWGTLRLFGAPEIGLVVSILIPGLGIIRLLLHITERPASGA
jgi:hypothetical protein